MATVNFNSLYKYVSYPTFDFVLQSTPYTSPLSDFAVTFPGPQSGSPVKFRILPASSGWFSATLYVGTNSNNMWDNDLAATGTYTAGSWKEFTLTAGQLSVLANNSSSFIYLSVYEDPPFYTTGANAPHLVVPDKGSIRVNVGGTWKLGIPYVNIGGAWKQGAAYVNIGGAWKTGI